MQLARAGGERALPRTNRHWHCRHSLDQRSKLQVWGGAMPETLPAGGVYAYGELGRALSPAAAGDAAVDAFAAMVDGALATLGDTAARHAATADALSTLRAAVQAQHMAWQERM